MITKEEASKRALEFLQQHTVGTIGTASLDGVPFVSPVYYSVEPDFSIYFSTSHHTQKFKNLVLNPQIAFSVGTGPDYITVTMHGVTTIVSDADESEARLKGIATRVETPMASWPIRTIESLETGGISIVKITPTRITYLDLTKNTSGNEKVDYFYEILP